MDFLQWQGWICLAWLFKSCAGTSGMLGCLGSSRTSEGLLAGAAVACMQVRLPLGSARAGMPEPSAKCKWKMQNLHKLSLDLPPQLNFARYSGICT